MEPSELTRAVIGLPAAAIVPAFVPRVDDWRWRTLAAGLLAIWALGPLLDQPESWLLVAFAVAGTHAVGSTEGPGVHVFVRTTACAAALAIAAALIVDTGEAVDGVEAAFRDGETVIVAAGALVAIFPGGVAIARLLAPFASLVREAESRPDAPENEEEEDASAAEDLANAGRYIGWLERALLYGFVVAGAPGAVPIVVAAKSIARFPSFTKEKFAEYFLIGTLFSVVVAVGMGVAVRAVLQLSPVLA
jgi:hypothetical protein